MELNLAREGLSQAGTYGTFLYISLQLISRNLVSDPRDSSLWLLQSDCKEKLSDTYQTSKDQRWTALIKTFSFPKELSIK